MYTDMVRDAEELSLNAWPSLKTSYYDGWVLRFANGYTRRANSINPLYPSRLDVSEKIAYCEKFYAEKNLPTIFKISPAVLPGDLDTKLEAMGYSREAPTSVQTMSLHNYGELPQDKPQSQLSLDLTDAWVDEFCRLSKIHLNHHPTIMTMLNSITGLPCFGRLHDGMDAYAVGLAVVEHQYVGLFDIVTAEAHRRKGYAGYLIWHLLSWATQQGAATAYLQVMCKNSAALQLYKGLGFVEIYQYWYRVKPC